MFLHFNNNHDYYYFFRAIFIITLVRTTIAVWLPGHATRVGIQRWHSGHAVYYPLGGVNLLYGKRHRASRIALSNPSRQAATMHGTRGASKHVAMGGDMYDVTRICNTTRIRSQISSQIPSLCAQQWTLWSVWNSYGPTFLTSSACTLTCTSVQLVDKWRWIQMLSWIYAHPQPTCTQEPWMEQIWLLVTVTCWPPTMREWKAF